VADPASEKPERRGSKRTKRSRRRNPDGTMTLIEHVYEFRRRLAYGLMAIVLGGIFGFIWFGTKLGPIPSLGDLMTGPYCALPAGPNGVRIEFNGRGCELLQTKAAGSSPPHSPVPTTSRSCCPCCSSSVSASSCRCSW
jgi:sec-independent protein translocase protein TatC